MPSPWVTRALNGSLPVSDRTGAVAEPRDLCVICESPDLTVGPYGHDWLGGRAHGACIVQYGSREAFLADQEVVTCPPSA